jgi:hypothetical protein
MRKFLIALGIASFFTVTHAQEDCALVTQGEIVIFGDCSAPLAGGSSKRTDTKFYTGFVWTLGENFNKVPELVLGVQSIGVKTNNRVSGADLNVRVNMSQSLSLEGVRLSYVGGKRHYLGNIGVGYSFAQNTPLMTGAFQTAYFRAGSDYLFGQEKFAPYVEINTLKPIKQVKSGASCGNGGEPLTVLSNNPPASNDPLGLYAEDTGPGNKLCFEPSLD